MWCGKIFTEKKFTKLKVAFSDIEMAITNAREGEIFILKGTKNISEFEEKFKKCAIKFNEIHKKLQCI